MKAWIFARLEWKQMLRSRWMQVVAALFAFTFAAISAIQQMAWPGGGFTRQAAGELNVLLFLLPLFLLTIGSMSIAADLESGWFSLLRTYPLSLAQYVLSKYAALLLSFALLLALAFSAVAALGGLAGGGLHGMGLFAGLSLLLIAVFASLALFIGSLAKNRLHALALSLVVWACWLLLLSYALMALGTVAAGHVVQKLIIANIHLNPAEWIRFGYFLFSGQTNVLGPAFYPLAQFYSSAAGNVAYAGLSLAWIAGPLYLATAALRKKGGAS